MNAASTKEFCAEVRQIVDQLAGGDGEAQVREWLAKRGKGKGLVESVQKIPGDASDRRYYRVFAQGGGGGRTYILMRTDPFTEQGQDFAFLVVRGHLASSGVDVPNVLDVDPARGSILLEDLGDVTLLRRLQEVSSPEVERHLYERVIDSLVQLQISASPKPGETAPPALAAFKLCFDYEKLMWEVGFGIEHFYQTYLKRTIRDADRKVLDQGFGEICRFLAEQPTVLAHRDFHSRNVMVVPGANPTDDDQSRFVMIDFQDARLGPAQYDLVSLLRDSYYQLEEQQITRLIDYYVARYEAQSGSRIDRDRFRNVFDMMAIQRNFKAIGSFASFLNRRGNATYLKYIGNTFENIRRTLLKYPQYTQLREVLFHYYYF